MATSANSFHNLSEMQSKQISSAKKLKIFARELFDAIFRETTKYIDNLVTDKLSTAYQIKGSVVSYADLHNIANKQVGWVYTVQTETFVKNLDKPSSYADTWTEESKVPPGTSYVYVMDDEGEYHWDPMGGSVDLSGYYQKGDIDNKLSAITDGDELYVKKAQYSRFSEIATYAGSYTTSLDSKGHLQYDVLVKDENPIRDTYVRKSGSSMTGTLDLYGNSWNTVSYVSSNNARNISCYFANAVTSNSADKGLFGIKTPVDSASYKSGIRFYNASNSAVTSFYYDGTQGVINGSNATYTLKIEGNLNVVETSTAKQHVSISDRRLKDNIKAFDADLSQCQAYSYNYKGDETSHVGLIAQDIQKVIPQAIVERNGSLALDYNSVVAVLVNKVNQLNARLAEVESKYEDLLANRG